MLLKLLKKIPHNIDGKAIYQSIDYTLSSEFKELNIDWKIIIKGDNIFIDINGEDIDICKNYIQKLYGIYIDKKDIICEEEYTFYIQKINNEKIILDGGFFSPTIDSFEMKKLGFGTIEQICSRFGIIEHIPIKVNIIKNTNLEKVKLSKDQIDLFWSFKKLSTDCLIINNCTKSQLKDVLKKTKHERDIYRINKLGILECILICKIGTDGPGLVASIGPFLNSKIGVIIGSKK